MAEQIKFMSDQIEKYDKKIEKKKDNKAKKAQKKATKSITSENINQEKYLVSILDFLR